MTGPRKHPCYPGTDRPILIGDTAHDSRNGRSGVVESIWSDDVKLGVVFVPVKWLRSGPAPEPEPPLLAIRPTWAELRRLVALFDRYEDLGGKPGTARELISVVVVDAIPADIAARLRAEIEAGL